MQGYKRYLEANDYLNAGLIRSEVAPPEAAPQEQPTSRCELMAAALGELGDPQKHFKAIHIAGTSGKGSTAIMVAEMLRAAKIRVGLHVTPYLQVSTEKLWVDGSYATSQEFVELINWIRPWAESSKPRGSLPLHGIVSLAITFEYFRRKKVDVAVVEAGVGGRRDLTRVINTDIAVIGPIGRDHLRSLGPTLEDIAWHKAGIIRPGCHAVVLDGLGRAAAEAEAAECDVPLTVIETGHGRLRARPLGMLGTFQGDNAALAVAAVKTFAQRSASYVVDDQAIKQGLSGARLPGRCELINRSDGCGVDWVSCNVLLDGAHNQDKLNALCSVLQTLKADRIHLIYGQLQSKEAVASPQQLANEIDTVIFTEPKVYGKESLPAAQLAQQFEPRSSVGCHCQPSPIDALKLAAKLASPQDLIVVTGSIYLVGNIRSVWYPDAQVLSRCTSFW